jgi:hypothetical protein
MCLSTTSGIQTGMHVIFRNNDLKFGVSERYLRTLTQPRIDRQIFDTRSNLSILEFMAAGTIYMQSSCKQNAHTFLHMV